MFRWLQSLWSGRVGNRGGKWQSLRRPVRAGYDTAKNTDETRRHWANADALSASAANTLAVRQTLRQRARYEAANNAYCQGLLLTLANDLIGVGPRLAVLTEDEAFNRAVEQAFLRWTESVQLGQTLHVLKQSKTRDGEGFLLLTSRDDARAVTLDLRLIECDQISTATGAAYPRLLDGIEVDAAGRVTGYHLLRDHPGDLFAQPFSGHDVIPAAAMIHWFRRDRPGQYRGVPEITASLPLFAQKRRFTLATLTAAETAASFAAMLETEAPPEGSDEEPTPFESLEIERGMMTTLPAGAHMHQLSAQHPATTYDSFKRELLKEIGRSVNAPFNVVAGDSSLYNFSSARLDHLLYRGALRVEREHCRVYVLEPIFSAWLAEAVLVPGLLPAPPEGVAVFDLPHAWYWPGFEAIDPLKEALADTERLANHTTTLAELLAEYGQDWEVFLRQRGREVTLMREMGLSPATPSAAATTSPADSADPANPASAEAGINAYLAASAATTTVLRVQGASEGFELLAGADGAGGASGASSLKKFRMVAYTGTAMRVGMSWPVVVDLAGLKIVSQQRPILRDHAATQIVGHTERIEVSEGGQRLYVAGVISGVGDAAREVVSLAANGFPWQASIGAAVERMEFVDRGETVKVNGRSFAGPIYVARATTLGEVSFVPMGADSATSASVAAQGASMTFEQWLAAKGFDPAAWTETQRLILQAAWKAETAPPPPPPAPALPTPAPPLAPSPASPGGNLPGHRTIADIVEAAQVEEQRQRDIVAQIADAVDRYPGQLEEWNLLGQLAIKDKWTKEVLELKILRDARPRAGMALTRHEPVLDGAIIEAAVCLHAGLDGLEERYGERTVEAARRRWRGGLSLAELVLTFAQRNGFRGQSLRGNLHDALTCAFTAQIQAAGSTSPSLHSLSGVLSNIANKFLRLGFDAVDSAWRMITAIRPVNDFKTITTYSLTGDLTYDALPPGGEIKHGTLGAESYTNRADTFAKMIGIDRRDLINDDLNALTRVAFKLGRGGAIKLNKVFWGVFLNNSAFFTAGRNNAFSGGTTALSITALGTADEKFRLQTDPDGNPIGSMPHLLVVPTSLRITATNLVNAQLTAPDSTGTANTAVGTQFPTRNPFQSAYTVVSSPYMQDASLTGNSATAWYLLADPSDLPVIEVAFLNGQESPTVESADADFGTLGIAMRGFHDFGCALQEYRGGIRMAGA